jgi:hypothetical protein
MQHRPNICPASPNAATSAALLAVALVSPGCAGTPRVDVSRRNELVVAAASPAQTAHTSALAAAAEREPAHASYADAVKAVADRHRLLAGEYARGSGDVRRRILAEADRELHRALVDDLFSFWMGTAWGYSGTTQTPRAGRIACGYFVTTVLRDAGFKVQRVSLAQQASENIILSLTHPDRVRRFRNVPLAEFLAAVRKTGRGVHVVGLDSHVGFLVCDGAGLTFVHASSLPPASVVSERAEDSVSLRASKYRVVGTITGDRSLLWKWLASVPILTRTK